MSTDGMNPFMNSNTHSTWPIVLTILILPPYLCNKRKYIMMSGLISGPQQSENVIDIYFSPLVEDLIDIYFRPLVEDLKELWYNNEVQVWDEHKHEYFGLKAIWFVTVIDSPAARNLLGQRKKVGCEYPYYFREIDSQYLSKSQK
jgi:hypothetical protein